MDFNELLLPTSESLKFRDEGFFVWCSTMFRHGDAFYMIYSRWEKEHGFIGWVTHSEVCLARADSLLGEFRFVRQLFGREPGSDGSWRVVHNPTVITHGGRHWLYCMNNYGHGDVWEHRNNQRIGVACCTDPEGEWEFVNERLIDVTPGGIDSLMTSNPTATVTPEGKILMIYKAVDHSGPLPKGGKVLCGAAIADAPDGPFVKYGKPIFENPEDAWSVEDPFLWYQDGQYHTVVKDFQGYFTGAQKHCFAHFVSENGFDWRPDEHPLAYRRELDFGGGDIRPLRLLDRPQLYIEDGVPRLLLCAVMEPQPDDTFDHVTDTYSIRIPLKA